MIKNNALKAYGITEIDNVKIHGRNSINKCPIPLFESGSAVEVNVSGSELWIDIEVDFDTAELWAIIWLNGALISRLMLLKGRQKLCLIRGMNPDAIKNITFMRESQAMAEDESNHLLVHGLETDGSFFPITDKTKKIEFIGDSITSGVGVYGQASEADWIPVFAGISKNYTTKIAEALDAEFRCLSQSGWGLIASWDNDPNNNIPDHYEKVCALAKGPKNEALGASKPHDFFSWQPDAIIVNLGTNDDGAFGEPAWIDPVTNESHKLRPNAQGTYHEEDLARIGKAVMDFLHKLRRHNPHSFIIWAYGMAGHGLAPTISDAVKSYQATTSDMKTAFLLLPDTTDETMGSLMHPGEKSHRKAADMLIEFLRGILI